MKKLAKAASTPTTTTSIAMIPMLAAMAIGESFCPKHTGHASAARGAARKPNVSRIFRISKIFRFPLKDRAVHGEHSSAQQRCGASNCVPHVVLNAVLTSRPRGEKSGEHDRQ